MLYSMLIFRRCTVVLVGRVPRSILDELPSYPHFVPFNVGTRTCVSTRRARGWLLCFGKCLDPAVPRDLHTMYTVKKTGQIVAVAP